MDFASYQESLRRNSEELAARAAFVRTQPKQCPKCGCQVFDPFVGRQVIHDVANCEGAVDTPPGVIAK